VYQIDDDAFAGCSKLKSVVIYGMITNMGWNIFDQCTNLTSLEYWPQKVSCGRLGYTQLDVVNVSSCYAGDTFCGVNISRTFERCGQCGENLSWIIIGDESNNTLIVYGNGKMYSFDDSYIPSWYSYRSSVKNIIISNGVTSIGEGAFSGFNELVSIFIHGTVQFFGSDSFSGCDKLVLLEYSAWNYPNCPGNLFEECPNLVCVNASVWQSQSKYLCGKIMCDYYKPSSSSSSKSPSSHSVSSKSSHSASTSASTSASALSKSSHSGPQAVSHSFMLSPSMIFFALVTLFICFQ